MGKHIRDVALDACDKGQRILIVRGAGICIKALMLNDV